MKPLSKEKMEYIANYKKEHYKYVTIKLRYDTDKDILDFFETLKLTKGRSDFMVKAIREKISREK